MHLLICLALYFLPTIIAHARHSVSTTGIFVVNFLFGWTGIGWLLVLVWAVVGTSWDNVYYRHPYYGARYPARW
jgi:hypothetical protein